MWQKSPNTKEPNVQGAKYDGAKFEGAKNEGVFEEIKKKYLCFMCKVFICSVTNQKLKERLMRRH